MYFFDIFIDNEIDENLICEYANNKSQSLLTGKVVKCEDNVVSPSTQLYTSIVTNEKEC